MPSGARSCPGLVAVALLTATCAGCGGGTSGRSLIRNDAAAVVAAVNAKQVPAARSALDKLGRDLAAVDQLHELDPATASALRTSVAKLMADLDGLGPGLRPVVTPSPTPSPLPTLVPPRTRKRHHGDKHD